ncbi:MAG: redoxin domain-containing protein [Bryobacteraceae bacterium]
MKSQEGKTVNLHDFKGKWVVLYFYPKDMTQGCRSPQLSARPPAI